MSEEPKTLAEKMKELPEGACTAGILDEHHGVKRPYLFYYEEAIDNYAPVPDKVENMISTDNLEVGDEQEIRFKRIDLTDAEYEAIPIV